MAEYFGQKLAMSFLMILATAMATAQVSAGIPAGTSVQVRIIEKLSSETANVGQVFHGTLAAPVVANGRMLFPKGAQVTGEVVNVERSGRLSTPGELHLSLRTIRSGARSYAVAVLPIVIFIFIGMPVHPLALPLFSISVAAGWQLFLPL